jgi:hypothetical protein
MFLPHICMVSNLGAHIAARVREKGLLRLLNSAVGQPLGKQILGAFAPLAGLLP